MNPVPKALWPCPELPRRGIVPGSDAVLGETSSSPNPLFNVAGAGWTRHRRVTPSFLGLPAAIFSAGIPRVEAAS
jgi:hypothetical protein